MSRLSGFNHYSVMRDECINALKIKPSGIYLDCTAGGGGHSIEIAKRLTDGKLIAIDQDKDAIAASMVRLSEYKENVIFVNRNFSEIDSILTELKIEQIDGALIDLGVSSYQLDTADRGFSYMQDAPLDMRMNREQSFSAYDVVNNYSEQELKRVLYSWGEEKFAPKIAAEIIRAREIKPIEGTLELVDLIKKAMPTKAKAMGHHPAKRSFQAIRIEVNKEIDVIAPTLKILCSSLKVGGRLAVLTFHSIEDRITKQTFAILSKGCICPPDFPVCVCGIKPAIKPISKAMAPSDAEIEANPRSRSAKLRIIEKI